MSWVALPLGATTATPQPASTPDAWHERVIAALRQRDSVRAFTPPVHRVAAVYNREAVVPPQCYTRNEGAYNACYVCHQDEIPGRENRLNDGELQAGYSFSDVGQTNHWKNLFEDRTERIAAISDEDILAYIAADNYTALPQRLREADFKGWIPDLKDLHLGAAAFDEEGFARDGSAWVAFNYKPFPSTFWPTNGSTDDVMIRLAAPYRTNTQGQPSRAVYQANLALLEAAIKGLDSIACPPIDEFAVGADLDDDGALGTARRVVRGQYYVGGAANEFCESFLYPEHTEFLHTVRYVGIGAGGEIQPSRRMKEVRYMRKWRAYAKPVYARRYQEERFEKELGHLPGYQFVGDNGLDNGSGWAIQGFIEDAAGRLRTSTYEENLFCMGCHNSVGSTIDKTFSFARKVDGPAGWKYIDLRGMADAPNRGESRGEILTYLERVGGGSEFRHNAEMAERWFNADGTVDEAKVRAADVHALITPSASRALQLNKAYRTIVQDQDFIYGRDAIVTPPANVYPAIDNATTPTLPRDRVFRWDIVLDWTAPPLPPARSPVVSVTPARRGR